MGTTTAENGDDPSFTLEGTYTPSGYLEEPVTLDRPDYTAKLENGCIVVTFRAAEPSPSAELQAAVDRDLRQVFTARMILTCQPWELTELRLHRRYPDGRKDVWLSVASGVFLVSGSPVDFSIHDAAGNVIKDTKAER